MFLRRDIMITARNAKKEDLVEIAKVHIACFKGYFLTSLGTDLLEKYYEEYLNENAPFVLALDEEGNIAGFCMGYLSGSRARSIFEDKYKKELFKKLIVRCLKLERETLKRVFNKLKSIIKKKKPVPARPLSAEKKGELLSICVLDKHKGTGASTILVNAFEKELKERNISKYNLSVYKNNARGIGFYTKYGFEKAAQTNDEFIFTKSIL